MTLATLMALHGTTWEAAVEEDVVTRLRAAVPTAFWSRKCDPLPLGLTVPPEYASDYAAALDTRQVATAYQDADDPLFD